MSANHSRASHDLQRLLSGHIPREHHQCHRANVTDSDQSPNMPI